jgi:thymidylate kinase
MYKIRHIALIVLWMCQPLWAAEINGVLLEGGEYSGKTSVANALEKMLTQKGLKITRGHAVLTRSPVIMMLNKEAFRSLPKHIPLAFPDNNFFKRFNGLRTAQLMLDMVATQEQLPRFVGTETFLIQDRHWHSQKFMNLFFSPGALDKETKWLEDHHIKFKHKVYLTCAHKIRLQRSKKYPKYGAFAALDEYFLFHVHKVDIFDKFCMDLLQKEGGWIIIDTTGKKPEEIAQDILSHIQVG